MSKYGYACAFVFGLSFAGMIGVTVFGLFLTPVFYVALRKLAAHMKRSSPVAGPAPDTNRAEIRHA
jgi:hypothetical protein